MIAAPRTGASRTSASMTGATERRVSPRVRVCLTGDGGVLMDVERDRMYSVDRIGASILTRFAAGQPLETIALDLSNAYEAPVSVVRNDVRQFLDRLERDGLIEHREMTADAERTASATTATMPSTPGPRPASRPLPAPSRRRLVGHAVWRLLRVDLALRLKGFTHLYHAIAQHPIGPVTAPDRIVIDVREAVDRACAIYPRQALCLQRSAAATWLLRDYGVPATLVVGARKYPFRAHAWVEVDGTVVNDKRGVKDYYQELDRL